MNVALACIVGALLLVGAVALAVYEWRQSNAQRQAAEATAEKVDATEEQIELEAAALAKKLAADDATMKADAATAAAKDAQLQIQLKAAEGASDAALDGYLLGRGLVRSPEPVKPADDPTDDDLVKRS